MTQHNEALAQEGAGVTEREALLPCPFCGGAPVLLRGVPGCWFVKCKPCGASGDDGGLVYAVKRWNTRAAPPPAASAEVASALPEIKFIYVNYRGEESLRRATPISIRYGHSAYHQTQWLMLARDLDKNEDREFAMRDMTWLSHSGHAILALATPVTPGEREVVPRETVLRIIDAATCYAMQSGHFLSSDTRELIIDQVIDGRDPESFKYGCVDPAATPPQPGAPATRCELCGWTGHAGFGARTILALLSATPQAEPGDQFRAGVEAGDGWQDIATAPKNEDILLCAKGHLESGGGVVVGRWHSAVSGWITDAFDCNDYEFEPTHWRPLPAPPQGDR